MGLFRLVRGRQVSCIVTIVCTTQQTSAPEKTAAAQPPMVKAQTITEIPEAGASTNTPTANKTTPTASKTTPSVSSSSHTPSCSSPTQEVKGKERDESEEGSAAATNPKAEATAADVNLSLERVEESNPGRGREEEELGKQELNKTVENEHKEGEEGEREEGKAEGGKMELKDSSSSSSSSSSAASPEQENGDRPSATTTTTV